MSLNSDFVGLIISPNGAGFDRGTGYPIREGVVLTAYHVIPNIESYHPNQEEGSYILWPTKEGKHRITNVLFKCEKSDVAVVQCCTPDGFTQPILCTDSPESYENWDSFGYAKSSIDPESNQNKPETAAGKYFKKPNQDEVHQLRTVDYLNDEKFWKGMSGAPVFTVNTSQLTGVIIESSIILEREDGKTQPLFKGRLRAASIAHLLKNPMFVEAVRGDTYASYQKKHEQLLKDVIEQEPRLASQLKLGCCSTLIAALRQDPIRCIQNLKKSCKSITASEADKTIIRKIFHLLLSQIDIPCQWEGKHIHELNVSTRLLAELAVAKLYDVEPQFGEVGTGVIGKHVLPASQTELGFDAESSIEESAHTVAYFLYKNKGWGNEGLTKEALAQSPHKYGGVNATIRLLREDDDEVHRFELNAKSDEATDHALMVPEVRDALNTQLLPDLPIVIYDNSDASPFKQEEELQTYVQSFIEKILMS